MSVFVELTVGASAGQVSLMQADAIAAVAQDVGATGIRLVDNGSNESTIDPSIVGAYLAGRHSRVSFVIDSPTTHHAPYNLARRVLSFDRATEGRVGVVLRTGDGDEVSDAVQPDVAADGRALRWAEYAAVLTGLWESFPRNALLGDQASALVVDEELIRPVHFEGRFYRARGSLDGPASVQGRPVLLAADPAELGWARIAKAADAVIVDPADAVGAADALSGELVAAGRRREDVAVLLRVFDDLSGVPAWTAVDGINGFVLAPRGSASEIEAAVRDVVPRLRKPGGSTLRSSLGLPDLLQVNA
jgi:alkanesulfonate monooxygenase SsuD/methylene tetrahydromethanopterin reductase-like flavin-dependent oxidoreductase (luciferase family)